MTRCGSHKLTQNFKVSHQTKRPPLAMSFQNSMRRRPFPMALLLIVSIISSSFGQELPSDPFSCVLAQCNPDPNKSFSLFCNRYQTLQ